MTSRLMMRPHSKAGLFARAKKRFMQRSMRRRVVQLAFITVNGLVLVGVASFILHSRLGGSSNGTILSSSVSANQVALNPLDEVSSADIAATVAKTGGMAESIAVKNSAESADSQIQTAPTNNNVVTKPQVVATAFKSKDDIRTYAAQAGDTVTSIAAKFGVTSDSIRWSNNLSGNTVSAGQKLVIPPFGLSGIVYTVKAGDTLDSLAQKYQADKDQLIAANDAEIKGLSVGEQIIIPNGQQPVVASSSRSSSTASSFFSFSGVASYGSNGYDLGYCTWYVANKRILAGSPLPTNLGNASTWGVKARAYGLPTGRTPQVGAAVVTSTSGEGHVAYVEVVNDDGSIWVSEMNSHGQVSITNPAPTGGWGVRDFKHLSAGEAASLTYIY